MSAMFDGDREQVAAVLAEINRCWREGRPEGIAQYLHEGAVMVYPGFAGRVVGEQAVVAGYEEFCNNAEVESYEERDLQIDVSGDTAVASYAFEMVYVRDEERTLAAGRDLFVLSRGEARAWRAVFRMMIDLREEPA